MTKQTSWRSEKKDGPRSRHRTRTSIQWESAPSETLRAFVNALTMAGCAVMFGRTSDGGALSLLILAGDDKYREYITTASEILPTFLDVLEDLELALPIHTVE